MKKIKAVAVGFMLICATEIVAADIFSYEGVLIVHVPPEATLLCKSPPAFISNEILLEAGNLESSVRAKAAISCEIDINVDYWDLKIRAANNGRLIHSDGTTPFKTDIVKDGKLGSGGSVWVEFAGVGESTSNILAVQNSTLPHGVEHTITKNDGVFVNVSTSEVSLPGEFAANANYFTAGESNIKVTFDIKAGVIGNAVEAKAGIYSEIITLTLMPSLQ
jgi:hypothetical protein